MPVAVSAIVELAVTDEVISSVPVPVSLTEANTPAKAVTASDPVAVSATVLL